MEARGRQDLDLHLRCSQPLESLRTVHELRAGDRLDVALSWSGAYRHHRFSDEELLAATARDASFSVFAFRRIGFEEEARAFLGWVLDTFEHGSAPRPRTGHPT